MSYFAGVFSCCTSKRFSFVFEVGEGDEGMEVGFFDLITNKVGQHVKRILSNIVYPRQLRRGSANQEQSRIEAIGWLAPLHYLGIHAVRKFTVNGHLLGEDKLDEDFDALEALANKCRNAFASVIGRRPENLHCNIKLREGQVGCPSTEWKAWTLARSEQSTACSPRAEFGAEAGQQVGGNSAFAALVGCSDGHTEWGPQPYGCFSCGDLPKYAEYVNNGRENWADFYRAAIVFPLRWLRGGRIEIKGFLSFDSKLTDIFIGMPCIFGYKDNFQGYYKKLTDSPVYHVGGIIADVLTMTIVLQDKNENEDKEIENVNGE